MIATKGYNDGFDRIGLWRTSDLGGIVLYIERTVYYITLTKLGLESKE